MWILYSFEQIQRQNFYDHENEHMYFKQPEIALKKTELLSSFLDFLTLEDGTDIFSGNVGKWLLIYSA